MMYAHTPRVPQIEFHNWSDKNAPEDYWRIVSSLAQFIGASLNSTIRPTTILVNQAKEKFGQVRVYCSLSDMNLVTKLWLKSDSSRSFMTDVPVSDDFLWKRRREDAIHYRRTYRSLINVVPQYHNVITGAADFPGLLCESRGELNELLASPYHNSCGFDSESEAGQQALDVIYK